MANTRNTTRTRTQAAQPRTTPRPAPVVDAVERAEEAADAVAPVTPCKFPREMRGDRCPVAVFNAPRSPREKIASSGKVGARPLAFERGLLAVFEDAELVRRSNPGGSTYIEAEDRLASDPLICDLCSPKTRWYSARAFQEHTAFAHANS